MAAVERMRFRPNQRLISATDYQQVFKAPDLKAGQQEVLLLARRNDLSHHRLGLAVAKKHIRTAVKRNQLKRLAREAFRTLKTDKQGLDIVVLSRPGAAKADRAHLRRALDRQFQRLESRKGAA